METYMVDDYIEEAKPGEGFGHRGYKYRVMDRQKISPTHHTNDLQDAQKWARKCIKYWNKQDSLSQ